MRLFLLAIFLIFSPLCFASKGLINIESPHDVGTTTDLLVHILKTRNMKIFDRVDLAAQAASVGKPIRPTSLIIFGNPVVGSPLIQCQQKIAIDLPQKYLIWLDDEETTWISYNDPAYLKSRHEVSGCDSLLQNMSDALDSFARSAAQ